MSSSHGWVSRGRASAGSATTGGPGQEHRRDLQPGPTGDGWELRATEGTNERGPTAMVQGRCLRSLHGGTSSGRGQASRSTTSARSVGAGVGKLPPPLGPTGDGGSGGRPAMEGAGSKVRPATEGIEERGSTEGNGEQGAPGALTSGRGSASGALGRGAAQDKSAREGGGEREIFAIYTSGRSG